MKIKPIISIDIKDGSIKQYDSLIEAEKYGFKAPKISLCCGGKRKSHKGFFWLFKQNYKEESYQEYLKLYNDHTHEKIILEEKKCTKCGILKKIDDFNKRRTGRTGVYSACKDCEYKKDFDGRNTCTCEGITEDKEWSSDKQINESNKLIYSYFENGWFYVGDFFGCVHFKEK